MRENCFKNEERLYLLLEAYYGVKVEQIDHENVV
jgi:hypothetical protein